MKIIRIVVLLLLFCLTGISSACGNHEKEFQSSYETISMAEEERDATASLWGNPEILFYRKIAYYSDAVIVFNLLLCDDNGACQPWQERLKLCCESDSIGK